MSKYGKFLLAVALSAAFAPLAQAQVVIVNAGDGASELSKDKVAAIFGGKDKSLTPVDNAALRNAFYPNVVGKSSDQIKAYWAKLEFTGKGKAPHEESNGQAVANYVASNPGTIGYVDAGDVGAGVKKVFEQ
ncbi:MAG: hypothetical protein IKU14_04280 [Rhodocyclaceae bacterium]|nr:hypothetical protein [Rhodocyclaceae bacterium]